MTLTGINAPLDAEGKNYLFAFAEVYPATYTEMRVDVIMKRGGIRLVPADH